MYVFLWLITPCNLLHVSDELALLQVFYIHGSVHRESNLIIVQQDATYSVYYISVGDQPRGLVVRVSDY